MIEKTRLAPSPTGSLHLGNARTFLVNWALARQRGWRVLLRLEDLDGPRVKPEAVQGIVDTLRWLGLDWDQGPLVQSQDLSPYRRAMEALASGRLAFPCALTRTEVLRAASAPQEGAHEVRYAPSLRPERWEPVMTSARTNWRFLSPDAPVAFDDGFAGRQSINPARVVGDFIVWTKAGVPAYQLAVVVDDHRQGITQVVRGDDLLDSAARQLLLYRALGFSPEPAYTHLPLVIGPDGKRLAKRHGESRLGEYRKLGVPPEAVIARIARWCGFPDKAERMSARRFAAELDLSRLPKTPIVFTPEDDARLRRSAQRL